jgi:predicted nucleic acid-binding Zn ribbon protein
LNARNRWEPELFMKPRRNRKSRSENRKFEEGPELIGEVLSRLFAARGWGRRQDRLNLERVWAETIGDEYAPHTRVGALRRGVLEILVDSAVLIQELSHFHKRRLLEGLRQRLPGTTITDLRFKAGVIDSGERG